ncbi:hypothetical protein ACJIZ3_024064 [Penstemon smallii]|uniref:Uncharacterized protein n=1 Tax=Penstemon smallii TaxID=265156 RepID=A0ABD3TT94_9LAMI
MEGKKQQSGSSFTSDLFGVKDSSSASGVFSSIFEPPPKVVGRGSLHSSQVEKKNDSGSQSWSAKTGVSDKNGLNSGDQRQGTTSKDMDSYYQEENVQPCHYSSSIYYGGQDVYTRPNNAHNPAGFPTFNKDGENDDSDKASRGNWWQGSLYY